jgi:hypothetical protein
MEPETDVASVGEGETDSLGMVCLVGNSIGPLEPTELADRIKDRSLPDWASGMLNCRGLVGWDSNQYIACVGIEDKLVEALLDTGGCCSLMDLGMAKKLKLPFQEQRNAEWGMFTVPGRRQPVPYPACIRGPIKIRLGRDVVVYLPNLRLVDHGRPLFILGVDALCTGAEEGAWEFVGMGPGKMRGFPRS